ncbi:hypothetical protein E0L31_027480, partial [Serratia marcescens]|nr:hypothetical protein [Serratia marcescens]
MTLTTETLNDFIAGQGFGVAPSAVEAMARELLANREAAPVGFIEQSGLDYLQSGADADIWPEGGAGDIPLYTAPPAPAAR